jgi:small subunit ribosomal protein S4
MPLFGPSKAFERKAYGPGTHGPKSMRKKHTEYALALMEKQKFRFYYGLMEKQFRAAFTKARHSRGVTGEVMLQILETRLDSMVYHLGFGTTRAAARQMINHGHVTVNSTKVDVPSYTVRVNDVVEVKDSSESRQMAIRSLEQSTSRPIPDWVSLNKDAFRGTLMRVPTRDEIQPIADEQVVVEFYSR